MPVPPVKITRNAGGKILVASVLLAVMINFHDALNKFIDIRLQDVNNLE